MHELSVAQGIIDIVCEYVHQEIRSTVREIRVDIGILNNVQLESLAFGFDTLKEDASLESAKLKINNILLEIKCKNCDTVSQYEELTFSCDKCASFEIEILKGSEFNVTEIETDD